VKPKWVAPRLRKRREAMAPYHVKEGLTMTPPRADWATITALDDFALQRAQIHALNHVPVTSGEGPD
jgi:hypothetical protein